MLFPRRNLDDHNNKAAFVATENDTIVSDSQSPSIVARLQLLDVAGGRFCGQELKLVGDAFLSGFVELP